MNTASHEGTPWPAAPRYHHHGCPMICKKAGLNVTEVLCEVFVAKSRMQLLEMALGGTTLKKGLGF